LGWPGGSSRGRWAAGSSIVIGEMMRRKIVLPIVLFITLLLSLVFFLNNVVTASLGWTIENTGFSGIYTSIALDSNSYPHISYLYSNNLTYVYKDATGWYSQTVDSSSNSVGAYTSLVLDSSDYPHICYLGNNGNLKYAQRAYPAPILIPGA
jgi:hypothetical protein